MAAGSTAVPAAASCNRTRTPGVLLLAPFAGPRLPCRRAPPISSPVSSAHPVSRGDRGPAGGFACQWTTCGFVDRETRWRHSTEAGCESPAKRPPRQTRMDLSSSHSAWCFNANFRWRGSAALAAPRPGPRPVVCGTRRVVRLCPRRHRCAATAVRWRVSIVVGKRRSSVSAASEAPGAHWSRITSTTVG